MTLAVIRVTEGAEVTISTEPVPGYTADQFASAWMRVEGAENDIEAAPGDAPNDAGVVFTSDAETTLDSGLHRFQTWVTTMDDKTFVIARGVILVYSAIPADEAS